MNGPAERERPAAAAQLQVRARRRLACTRRATRTARRNSEVNSL